MLLILEVKQSYQNEIGSVRQQLDEFTGAVTMKPEGDCGKRRVVGVEMEGTVDAL